MDNNNTQKDIFFWYSKSGSGNLSAFVKDENQARTMRERLQALADSVQPGGTVILRFLTDKQKSAIFKKNPAKAANATLGVMPPREEL